ncbi:MAG: hypothetical protein OXC03_07015 [Flavobacteriaceae bacterium]|nr:hypothetical protein [Flavobacteriaceae bacterium]
MNADIFKDSKEPDILKCLFDLLGSSYLELYKEKKNSPYSRKSILEKQKKLKGKDGAKTKLELEDYLRNDLVVKYLEVYKHRFEIIKYFHFVLGADEIKDGVSIGRLDIKVVLPSDSMLANQVYIAIECKRINKLGPTKKRYIENGMSRFINRQYYPEIDSKAAWMLSFMESEKKEHIQSSEKIVSSLNELLEELFGTSKYNS